jgi:hypothetical protein
MGVPQHLLHKPDFIFNCFKTNQINIFFAKMAFTIPFNYKNLGMLFVKWKLCEGIKYPNSEAVGNNFLE